MTESSFGPIRIGVHLGPYDDSKIKLTVKSKSIGATEAFGFVVQEASTADYVEYWPNLSLMSENRRHAIYETSTKALGTAEKLNIKSVAFFTAGLEVARVPSWEVAEEIAKAIFAHSKWGSHVQEVVIVSGSPTQVSSFQYAFENIGIIAP